MPSLMQLAPDQRRALRVLYLAPFAPERHSGRPEWHSTVGIRSIYHWEVYRILEDLGVLIGSCHDLDHFPAMAREANFVFSLFSRAPFRNCEVYVPAMCARLGVPLMGAPANVRALTEDKHYTKAVVAQAGIDVVPGLAYARPGDIPAKAPLPGPYFVKYRFGSASEDIAGDCAVNSWPEAADKAREFLALGKEPVVERLVPGFDVTVPVLGGAEPIVLSPVAEVSDLPHGIATFRQKRFLTDDRRRHLVAEADLAGEAVALARRVAAEMQPFDYMRIDFRLDTANSRLLFMETNIACNLGSTAAIMYSAGHHGLSHAAVIEHILAYSASRQPNVRQRWETVNL